MMTPAVDSLPRQPHTPHPSWREAQARPFDTLYEGAGMRLPAFLLGSNPHQRFLGRARVSLKIAPASKTLSRPSVKML
jgi:hypothetical protein